MATAQGQSTPVVLNLHTLHKGGVHPQPILPVTNHAVTSVTSAGEVTFITFLKRNFISFGLFILFLLLVFMVFVYATLLFFGRSTLSTTSVEPTMVKSVDRLFDKPPPLSSSPEPPTQPSHVVLQSGPPPPPPLPLTHKTFDTLFRMTDGALHTINETTIRVYELNSELADMDMLSIIFFTCCCNDKSTVVCDSRQKPTTSPMTAPSDITDYSVSCYLSHDPNVPAVNTIQLQYKHRWKLIVQFGSAFERPSTIGNTDCVFSTVYYTSIRPLPPPINPPASELAKKIW